MAGSTSHRSMYGLPESKRMAAPAAFLLGLRLKYQTTPEQVFTYPPPAPTVFDAQPEGLPACGFPHFETTRYHGRTQNLTRYRLPKNWSAIRPPFHRHGSRFLRLWGDPNIRWSWLRPFLDFADNF